MLYTSPYYVGSCAYDPAGNLYLSVSHRNIPMNCTYTS